MPHDESVTRWPMHQKVVEGLRSRWLLTCDDLVPLDGHLGTGWYGATVNDELEKCVHREKPPRDSDTATLLQAV